MFTSSCISRSAASCSKLIVCFNLDNYIVLSVSLHIHVYIFIWYFDTISYIYILKWCLRVLNMFATIPSHVFSPNSSVTFANLAKLRAMPSAHLFLPCLQMLPPISIIISILWNHLRFPTVPTPGRKLATDCWYLQSQTTTCNVSIAPYKNNGINWGQLPTSTGERWIFWTAINSTNLPFGDPNQRIQESLCGFSHLGAKEAIFGGWQKILNGM